MLLSVVNMTLPNITIGVDVGIHGGLAYFDTVSHELLDIKKMPLLKIERGGKEKNFIDLDKLMFYLEIPKVHNDSAIVVLEDLHAFPGQGVVSMATLLEQKGLIRGIAKGLGYTELLISPKTWQKHFNLIPPKELKGKKASQTKTLRKKWLKQQSIICATENFPEWKPKIGNSDGLSDACLIGYWYIQN